jgi:DNA repair protein RadC
MMRIKDWPEAERPREKLLARGAGHLSDAELLALFIRVGRRGRTAVDLARMALARSGGLRKLLEMDLPAMSQLDGFGPARHAELKACLELGVRYLEANTTRGEPLKSPGQTRAFLTAKLRAYPYEVFACVFLDNRHRVLCYEELFRGTIDGASVPPREVLRQALAHNAAAVIFAHNHPSGIAEPSDADKMLTDRLKRALALIEIRVLDHVIVGDGECASFAELGLL